MRKMWRAERKRSKAYRPRLLRTVRRSLHGQRVPIQVFSLGYAEGVPPKYTAIPRGPFWSHYA